MSNYRVKKNKSLPAAVKMLLGPASNELHKSTQPLTVLLPANHLSEIKIKMSKRACTPVD